MLQLLRSSPAFTWRLLSFKPVKRTYMRNLWKQTLTFGAIARTQHTTHTQTEGRSDARER